MSVLPAAVSAITLFVEDLEEAKRFYSEVLEFPVHFEDADSAVFAFAATLINLLHAPAAEELVTPLPVGAHGTAPRMQFTITVDDVDASCARLTERGVTLLNGPIDRPWGIRTAAFVDPDGHVWEIAR